MPQIFQAGNTFACCSPKGDFDVNPCTCLCYFSYYTVIRISSKPVSKLKTKKHVWNEYFAAGVWTGSAASFQVADGRRRRAPMTSSFGKTGNGTDGRVACEYPGCRREFRELKHLKVHRMQHTDERPLSCTLCTYSCRQRNSLNWHMKSRHRLSKTVTGDGRTVYVSSSWHYIRRLQRRIVTMYWSIRPNP